MLIHPGNAVMLIVITLYDSSSDPHVNVCLCRGRTLQQGERQVLQWPQVCSQRSGRSEMRWQPPIQREPLCSRNQTSLESNSLRWETQLSVLSLFYFYLHSIVCRVTMLLEYDFCAHYGNCMYGYTTRAEHCAQCDSPFQV